MIQARNRWEKFILKKIIFNRPLYYAHCTHSPTLTHLWIHFQFRNRSRRASNCKWNKCEEKNYQQQHFKRGIWPDDTISNIFDCEIWERKKTTTNPFAFQDLSSSTKTKQKQYRSKIWTVCKTKNKTKTNMILLICSIEYWRIARNECHSFFKEFFEISYWFLISWTGRYNKMRNALRDQPRCRKQQQQQQQLWRINPWFNRFNRFMVYYSHFVAVTCRCYFCMFIDRRPIAIAPILQRCYFQSFHFIYVRMCWCLFVGFCFFFWFTLHAITLVRRFACICATSLYGLCVIVYFFVLLFSVFFLYAAVWSSLQTHTHREYLKWDIGKCQNCILCCLQQQQRRRRLRTTNYLYKIQIIHYIVYDIMCSGSALYSRVYSGF